MKLSEQIADATRHEVVDGDHCLVHPDTLREWAARVRNLEQREVPEGWMILELRNPATGERVRDIGVDRCVAPGPDPSATFQVVGATGYVMSYGSTPTEAIAAAKAAKGEADA